MNLNVFSFHFNSQRLCERENILDKMIDPSQTEETRLSSVQLRKDGTLPRLFIYNNKPRVKSPLHLKKVMRYQTSPVLGSPRLNRVRGNKPKPCAAKTTTTSLKLVKPIRKSKFAISSKRIPIESKAAEIYPSFGGKEHDTVENADFQQEGKLEIYFILVEPGRPSSACVFLQKLPTFFRY